MNKHNVLTSFSNPASIIHNEKVASTRDTHGDAQYIHSSHMEIEMRSLSNAEHTSQMWQPHHTQSSGVMTVSRHNT